MRRLFAAALCCMAAVALGAAAAPQAQFNVAQQAMLDKLSASLNAVHSMQGGFVQIDPNGGLEQGKFYIEKPGRMRFEYAPPTPTLIVSDGTTIAVKNTKLNTVDRYPLVSTPLDLVLSDKLDLKDNKAVYGVQREGDSLIVKARSTDSRAPGSITIVFSDPGLELRQWTVIDAQGTATTVALRDVEKDVSLSPALFVLKEHNPFTRGDGN
ncbi:MAG: outer membrane lipoprotein carrier protein LolA [Alphaproteobacteria bacterium]|nr:outer membrane lipoprotein carrier protein LolA [Alphaproteobacteria bacterium]MDE2350678.1 outer membrane lipoprotein carrier protein LolA [Alphaproteobacteria bacterium]